MDDENKRLARNAQRVQNLQLMLIAGMAAGFVLGVLLAAYVVLPLMPGTAGLLIGVAIPIVGLFVGQRVVLWYLTR